MDLLSRHASSAALALALILPCSPALGAGAVDARADAASTLPALSHAPATVAQREGQLRRIEQLQRTGKRSDARRLIPLLRDPDAQVRERAESEPHLLRKGAGFVLYALMDEVVDRYFPILDQLEDELEAIEARIFEPGATQKATLQRLYELKRRIATVKHAVAPLLEAANKLVHVRAPPVCAGSREYFRDVCDHLARVNASLDSLRETISTATQVHLSMVMLDEAETTKRLAAWAAIFAVATTLVGVWGP